MTDFIQHIVARHTDPGKNIKPRVSGIFEPLGNRNVPLPPDSAFDPATNGAEQPVLQNSTPFDEMSGTGVKARPHAFGAVVPDAGNPETSTDFQNSSRITAGIANPQKSVFKKPATNLNPAGATTSSIGFESNANHASAAGRLKSTGTNEEAMMDPGAAKEMRKADDAPNDFDPVREPAIKPVQKQTTGNYAFTNPIHGFLERTAPLPQNTKVVHPQNAYPSRPVIKVTIGRVEVKAIVQATAPPKTSGPAKPKMSLDDYLKSRNNAAS